MELTNILALVSNFLHTIIVIVLTGVLLSSFLNNKKKLTKPLWYLPLLILILIFACLDAYRTFIEPSSLVNLITLIIALATIIVFVFATIKNWKYLNKKLFFSMIPLAIGILILQTLHKYTAIEISLYTSIFTLSINILLYFLILSLIINASGRGTGRR